MSKVMMVVEYKAPHKLPLTMLIEVLANMVSIYLDENFIENQRLVVSVIIQLFVAMVKNDIRYGYIDIGEAMVFLCIKDHDPFIVEYHISIPKSDAENEADADGKLRLSAVCQVLAFTIQAMKAPETTSDWLALTNNLPKWKDERMEAKDFSSGPDPKAKYSPYKGKRPKQPHPSDPDTAVTRSAFKLANPLAEEASDEDEADDENEDNENDEADDSGPGKKKKGKI
ncbi:hypothetical protein E4U58_005855 [Claviceps cyperi]|nr:hypothetical protein E4U58_005855 [Claviceps cyperi]